MKTFTMLATILLTTNILLGQYNTIDTSFYSEALQETKMVDIYFPPGYNDHPDWNYPVIYYLHAWNANQNTLIEMINPAEYLINNGTIDPVIMVSPDNSPAPFNGSMYVNSDLWGNYEDYMIDDLIDWIDNNFRTIPEKGARALLGQSMGAYGAFRYGIVHKDKFTALAAHAGIVTFNKDLWMEPCRQMVILENQPGPPYTYNFAASGPFTAGTFILSGAFSPNLNSPQTYIDPPVVEFLFDENAGYIDSILVKWQPFDLTQQIKQLSPEDSVGIYFGCGTNDNFLLYPANQALNDTLDVLGLPHEFYTHSGSHNMPTGFKHGALIFIDSLLMPPKVPPTSCLPEGITFYTQEEIDNFQTNYPDCTEIEGDVTIYQSNITNLNGLSVLNSIGGDFLLIENEALTSLTGLEGLTSIGGDLIVGLNISLTSLTGLEGLTYFGGSIYIGGKGFGNPSLNDLTGLEGLTTIGGNLYIHSNGGLTNLTGLQGMTSIGGNFKVMDNYSLTRLTGLEGLTSVGGDFIIYNNSVLTSLTPLEKLTSNGGELSIINNDFLTGIAGLEGLTSIGGGLSITDNHSLTNLTGLEGLMSIGGELYVTSNYSLTSLAGLEGLTTIGGSLNIGLLYGGNHSLTSLTGLEGLTTIGGSFNIYNNSALTSLTALEGLTTIGGGLSIQNNDALTSLAGLDSIKANSIQSLFIRYNSTLSICAIESICDYIAIPNVAIDIAYNDPGCNSKEELEDACLYLQVKEDGKITQLNMTISPNPVEDFATLCFYTDQPGQAIVEIFNTTGVLVRIWQFSLSGKGENNFILNLKGLPSGMYLCMVHVGNKQLTQKILKR